MAIEKIINENKTHYWVIFSTNRGLTGHEFTRLKINCINTLNKIKNEKGIICINQP